MAKIVNLYLFSCHHFTRHPQILLSITFWTGFCDKGKPLKEYSVMKTHIQSVFNCRCFSLQWLNWGFVLTESACTLFQFWREFCLVVWLIASQIYCSTSSLDTKIFVNSWTNLTNKEKFKFIGLFWLVKKV